MKKYFFTLMICSAASMVLAQSSKYIQVGSAFGSKNGTYVVASAQRDWFLGKKEKLVIGTGLRFSSYYGKNQYFTSAPASLAAKAVAVDSLLAPSPNINALNLMINLGYKLSEKLQVGFNIDAIGFAFGPEGKPSYIRNGQSSQVIASPTSPNILLVGNNDRGTLNSHFYGRYMVTKKLGIHVAYQFLFTELTTTTKVQSSPEANDRFRNKANQIYAGLSFNF
jgi:hypothetical protein